MSKEQIEEIANEICLAGDYCYGACGECYCLRIAERLYNAGYRKQEWISIDDRLPETKLTNVKIDSQDIESGKTMETEERMMNSSELVAVLYEAHMDGKFGTFVGFDQFVDGRWFYTDTVTHWMPLPEPPKMKGGAE
jgi:hypothetical protein